MYILIFSGEGDEYFYIDELQIYGMAQLAIETGSDNSVSNKTMIRLRNTIGDRTGSIHIGPRQSLLFDEQFVDLPFNTYVYADGSVIVKYFINLIYKV